MTIMYYKLTSSKLTSALSSH